MKVLRNFNLKNFIVVVFIITTFINDCKQKEGENPVFAFLSTIFSKSNPVIPTSTEPPPYSSNFTSSNIADEAISLGVVNLVSTYNTDPAPTNFVPAGSVVAKKSKLKIEIAMPTPTDFTNQGGGSLSFGTTSPNTSVTRQVTITNDITGLEADTLTIQSVSITSLGNQFTTNALTTYSIAPGASINFNLTFTPTSSGYKAGTFSFIHNDINNTNINSIKTTTYYLALGGNGTDVPIAVLLKTSTEVDRYQNLVIEFSHSMDVNSVCPQNAENDPAKLSLKDSLNNQILGKCFWANTRQLIFDPYKSLKSSDTHTITLTGALTSSGVNITRLCLPSQIAPNPDTCGPNGSLSKTFSTEAEFAISFTLNGLVVGTNGITFDQNQNNNSTTINLSGTITDRNLMTSLILKKLGSTSSHIVCPSACSGTPGTYTIPAINLQSAVPIDMRPTSGGNTYFFEVKTNNKSYYRSFSFNYGNPASNKNSPLPNVSSLLLDADDSSFPTGSSIRAMNHLLRRFARQQFKLNGLTLNEIVYNARLGNITNGNNVIQNIDTNGLTNGMIVTGTGIPSWPTIVTVTSVGTNTVTLSHNANTTLIGAKVFFRGGNSAPSNDIDGKPCLPWVKKDSSTFKILYLNKIGPFCNIQVTGTVFASYLYPDVKYAAIADVYITELNIPPIANPGALDNIEITLNPKSGSLEVELFEKKATGKMSLVAKIPNESKIVANVGVGVNNIFVPDTTNLIVGMIVSGKDSLNQNMFEDGTYISAINTVTNTITLTKNTIPSGGSRTSRTVKFEGIEFFDYLVGDTFVFSDDATYDGTALRDGDSLGFAMNEDPPVLTPQIALGSTLPFVSLYDPLTGYGKLGLVINPSMRFDPLNPNPTGSDKFTYTNPITQAWSNAIFVDPLIGSGAVASVVADVVNQKIPEVKPKIVQGVVKDIVERVAPDIVNIILKDVNNGIEVNLPSYLPGILKKVKAKVSAAINLDFESRNSGLTSSANLNLDGCLKASTAPGPCVAVPPSEAPPAVQTSAGAVDSFLTFKVPSNFTCSSTAGSPNLNCTGIGSTLSCTSIKDNFTVSCGSVGSLAVGNYVYGVNLPLGSYVTNISGLNVTLNKPASNAGAFTLTYSSIGPGFGVMGTNLASGSFVTNLSGTNLTLNKNALSTGSFTGYFSTIFGKAMMDTINSARTGVLIALHPDAVNQAVYHLWQKGALNLKLDLLFADEIAQNQYSGDTLGYRASTRILEIYQILLKAKSILRILAPGKTNMTAGDPPVLIEEDDDIAFTLNPILPPVIKPASGSPVPGISGTIANEKSGGVISGQIAKVEVFLGDLILNISGQKCISRNPISGLCTITGASYPIIKAKVSLTSKTTFKIANFSNPFNDPQYTQVVNGNTIPVSAVKLNICDDVVSGSPEDCDNDSTQDLYYTLEILDGPSDNPLGLSPNGIYDILNPTVQKLVVPLVNYILEEIPLPEMKNCGLQLYDLQVMPISNTANFFVINSKIANYNFTGDCKL